MEVRAGPFGDPWCNWYGRYYVKFPGESALFELGGKARRSRRGTWRVLGGIAGSIEPRIRVATHVFTGVVMCLERHREYGALTFRGCLFPLS